MASGGWNPKAFAEVVAQLESASMLLALQYTGGRTCPTPPWDTDHPYYRVALVEGAAQIQRSEDGVTWKPAPLKPPKAETAAAPSAPPKELTTETRSILFMDLTGWSKLAPTQLANYLEKALPRLDARVKGHKAQH